MQRVSLRQSFHAAHSQQRTVGPPLVERFSVTKNLPVPNNCLFTVARDSCLDSVQPNRSALYAACIPSAKLSRSPEPTEDCWATVNGTLLGNQKSPVPNNCLFTVARDSCLDSVQPNRSALYAACIPSAKLSRSPEPTEDCWATVSGTLLGNQESSSTERLSIHGSGYLRANWESHMIV